MMALVLQPRLSDPFWRPNTLLSAPHPGPDALLPVSVFTATLFSGTEITQYLKGEADRPWLSSPTIPASAAPLSQPLLQRRNLTLS